MKNAKLKHNKIKNTGIIWELLVRQLTNDILNENKHSDSVKTIIYEFFNKNTEIYKEYLLYKILLNTKYKNLTTATELIDESINTAKSINFKKLNIEKYNLIKKLKENYDLKEFFKTSIPNYVSYASVYKLLKLVEDKDVKTETGEVSLIKETLINNILDNSISPKKYIMEKKNSNDYITDKIAFKILIENFNKKYKNLNSKQKRILKIFIENPMDSIILKNEITEYINECYDTINTKRNKISDKTMKIKVKNVLDNINITKQKIKNNIMKPSLITNILLFEELKIELDEVEENNNNNE